jgi:hypothetical protein
VKPLTFNALLESEGLDPARVRLIRHKHERDYQEQVFTDALNKREKFDNYQSSQGDTRVISSIKSADYIASFVVSPSGETVFAGIWKVNGCKEIFTADPYKDGKNPPSETESTFDLARTTHLDGLVGKLLVEWGDGARAWVQRAENQNKPIIELRRSISEPPFPGWLEFRRQLSEIESMPVAWIEVLKGYKGIYLIVDEEDGSQYVGSATGDNGFFGRWRDYHNGHGGNQSLKQRAKPAERYYVVILQAIAPGNANEGSLITELETYWKIKLGSRVHGLNLN